MAESPETDQPTLKRRIPVPFFLNLAAGQFRALSSDRITFPYRIVKVQAHFRDDAANNLQVWAFVSRSNNVSGTAPPPDNKILGFYSPTPYLIGEGEIVSVDCDVVPDPAEQFLKVYFCNFNAYAMSGYCIITIETLSGVDQVINIQTSAGDERKYTAAEWLALGQEKAKAILLLNTDIVAGTSEKYVDEVVELKAKNQETSVALYTEYMRTSNFLTAIPPEIPKEDILKTVQVWASNFKDLSFKAFNDLFLQRLVTGALGGEAIDVVNWLEDTFGLQESIRKLYSLGIETAIMPIVEQYWDAAYTPDIPAVQDLINMVIKEKITLDDFKFNMKKKGINSNWSQKIWDAHFYAPDFQTVKQAIWRESIKHDEIPDMLKRVDLDPFYNDKVWYTLLYEVPPYQDLINMRVKEVINQETFSKSIQSHGFYDPWATRLWDAHFTPADFTDFLTAMRRKKTVAIPVAEGPATQHTFGLDPAKDIEAVKALSVLADYDPRYWDFFETRMYNDPSYRMVMWGYEAGAIDPVEVPDLVHRLGLNPKDEAWYTKFIMSFQERAWITRYLTALQSAYISDAITEEELKIRVRAIPRNEKVADWMVKIADVRKEIIATKGTAETAKLVTVSELKDAYTLGLLNEDNLRTELMGRGFTLLDVDLLINLINKKFEIEEAGGKKEGLTVAELFDAFRYSEISEDTLRTELMTKGLNLEQANILISTKKKKWEIGQVEGGD